MQTDCEKIAIVTGANSGLGKATSTALAKRGYRVVMVCRHPERGKAAQAEIVAQSGSQAVDLHLADVSSQESIRSFAAAFQAHYPRLDLLVNNVGVSMEQRQLTVDGIEYSFACNYLAPFLLTNLLLDVLKASAPARIVNVGTRHFAGGSMRLDDLQFERRPYRAFQVYLESKLGVNLFTYALARRLEGTGVTVNCVHPGIFQSNLGRPREANGAPESLLGRLAAMTAPLLFPTADKAAERVIYLATAPEMAGVSGGYYGDKTPLKSPPQSYDVTVQEALWATSARLTRLENDMTLA